MTDGIDLKHEQESRQPLKDARPTEQPGDGLGALHAASNEMEALRLVNQRLLRELAELTR